MKSSILVAFPLASHVLASSSMEQESMQSESSSHQQERKLTTAYGTNFFVDSENTEYNAYQTSWRYLGHIVKCGYPSDRYDEGGGSHSGSGDQYQGNHYCQRYLLWAAYVDPNYQGGGIGEYKIYNPSKGAYDSSSCNGSGRCAAMDCHDANTETWELMGIYKEAVYYGGDAFFEQLFKHEAYCVWNDEDKYEFMSDSREKWTSGCVETGYTDQFGDSLYIDLKPGYNGNMQNALYSDEICKTEYNGSDLDVDSVAYSLGVLSGNDLSLWNSYMEPFKVCQPCKAYNLNSGRRDLSNYNSGGSFQCDDDAGYTNVNQCMKFRAHGDLEIATWEDLVIGTEQGGILEIIVGQTYFGTKYMTTSQAQYLQNQMQKKAAVAQQEEDEYKQIVNTMPSTTPIMMFGLSVLFLGTVSLVGSIVWGVTQLDKDHDVVMEEPLILRKLATYNARKTLRQGKRVLRKVGVKVNTDV